MAKKKPTRDAIYRLIGARLRTARLSKGYSGDVVAKAIGLSEQQVLKFERAEARIPLHRLYDISNVLEMPLDFFLDELINGRALPVEDAHQLVRSTGDLVSLWQRVPTPERAHLLAVIRNAAEG